MRNVGFFNIILGGLMASCTSFSLDVEKEIQNKINEINISLNMCDWDDCDKEYLEGMAEGLFCAIELMHGYHSP